MKIRMYGLWDDKAKAYLQPFFMLNDDLALRSFANAANNRESSVCVNAEDYVLFYLGDFDDSNGRFSPVESPVVMCGALQLRRSGQ